MVPEDTTGIQGGLIVAITFPTYPPLSVLPDGSMYVCMRSGRVVVALGDAGEGTGELRERAIEYLQTRDIGRIRKYKQNPMRNRFDHDGVDGL